MEQEQLEKVVAWLEAGDAADYQAGVLLLQAQGGPRVLVNTLLKKESSGNREKLRYELVKLGCEGRMSDVTEVMSHLAQAVQGAVAPVAQLVPPVVAPFDEQPAPGAPVPEAVQGQYEEITQLMQRLYNQRCQLSNTLADLPEADGPRVVRDILSLEQQYNALSEKRRRLVAGEPTAEAEQLAPAEQPSAGGVDRADLLQQRQNLRSNISKGKGKAKNAKTEAKRSEYEQKVGQMEVELANLELLLKMPATTPATEPAAE